MSDDYKDSVERRRAKQRERYRKDPAVGRAYRLVQRAKKTGKLAVPPACTACGATGRLHGRHADYTRPLDVKFLCVPCHRDAHAVRRRVLTPVAVRLRQQGYGLRAIAETLGVAHRTIREWLNREGQK